MDGQSLANKTTGIFRYDFILENDGSKSGLCFIAVHFEFRCSALTPAAWPVRARLRSAPFRCCRPWRDAEAAGRSWRGCRFCAGRGRPAPRRSGGGARRPPRSPESACCPSGYRAESRDASGGGRRGAPRRTTRHSVRPDRTAGSVGGRRWRKTDPPRREFLR